MKLLETKKRMKAKMPTFIRTDTNQKKFRARYRKPRGLHNKIRLNKAGHQKKAAPGYGTPRTLRHFTREGLKHVLIFNKQGLEALQKNELPLLAAGVSLRNRIKILEQAQQKKIRIGNIKDIDAFLAKVKEERQKHKQELQKKETKKKDAQTEALKKAEEKKKEPEKTHEEKKEELEAEKRRVLQQERIKTKQEPMVAPKLAKDTKPTRMIPTGEKK